MRGGGGGRHLGGIFIDTMPRKHKLSNKNKVNLYEANTVILLTIVIIIYN